MTVTADQATENVNVESDATETDATVNTYSEKAIKFDHDVKAVISGTYRDADGDDVKVSAADLGNKNSDIVSVLVSQFNELDKDEKRQARTFRRDFESTLKGELTELDFVGDPAGATARAGEIGQTLAALVNAEKNVYVTRALSDGKTGGAPRKTVDPRADFVGMVAAVSLGYATMLSAGKFDTADILADVEKLTSAENVAAEALAYAEWLEGGESAPEPYATELAKQAARVSLGRSTGGQGKPPKGSVRSVPGYVAPTGPGTFSTIDPEKAAEAEKVAAAKASDPESDDESADADAE